MNSSKNNSEGIIIALIVTLVFVILVGIAVALIIVFVVQKKSSSSVSSLFALPGLMKSPEEEYRDAINPVVKPQFSFPIPNPNSKLFTLLKDFVLGDLEPNYDIFEHVLKIDEANRQVFVFQDKVYDIYDSPESQASRFIISEINAGEYDTKDIDVGDEPIIFDVGGHVGIASIMFATQYPKAKIVTFEPCPINFSYLIHNLKVNHIKNVFVLPYGVSKNARNIDLVFEKGNSGGTSAYTHDNQTIGKISVPTVKLDDIIDLLNLNKIDIFKIDTEGAEYEVLFNMKHVKKIKYLTGEVHDCESAYDNGRDKFALALHLLENGVKLLNITNLDRNWLQSIQKTKNE